MPIDIIIFLETNETNGKVQTAQGYNKSVKSRPPLLHVAPRADAGKIPYYAGKRQFLAILKWQEAV